MVRFFCFRARVLSSGFERYHLDEEAAARARRPRSRRAASILAVPTVGPAEAVILDRL